MFVLAVDVRQVFQTRGQLVALLLQGRKAFLSAQQFLANAGSGFTAGAWRAPALAPRAAHALGRNQRKTITGSAGCAGGRTGGAGRRIRHRGGFAGRSGTPIAVLATNCGHCRGGRHGLRFVRCRYTQHRAGLQRVDIVAIERLGIGLFERQQHLIDVDPAWRDVAGDRRQCLTAFDRTVLAVADSSRSGLGAGCWRNMILPWRGR